MKALFHFLHIAFTCMIACTPGKAVADNQHSIKDSILTYKVQGLKEFIKTADYWGNDTESYWAFEQADSLLDTALNLDNYEESHTINLRNLAGCRISFVKMTTL